VSHGPAADSGSRGQCHRDGVTGGLSTARSGTAAGRVAWPQPDDSEPGEPSESLAAWDGSLVTVHTSSSSPVGRRPTRSFYSTMTGTPQWLELTGRRCHMSPRHGPHGWPDPFVPEPARWPRFKIFKNYVYGRRKHTAL
jgi:hypothetical protein